MNIRKKKTILLLGPVQRNKFIKKFLKLKYNVHTSNDKITKYMIKKHNINYIITSGYPYLVKKNCFDLVEIAFNLHISFLPYGRGLIPNVWSFYENYPSGISIHLLSSKFDQGDILLQRRINFRNLKKHTLKSTHDYLIKQLNKMFKINCEKILSKKIVPFQQNKYTKNYSRYHTRQESNKLIKKFNIKWSDKIIKIINKRI